MLNPNPVAFTLLGKDIYWYGIVIALGVLMAILLAIHSGKKYGWTEDDILDFAILAIPLGVIGARLYYVVFQWDLYKDNIIDIFKIWEGGLALYGALIFGILAAIIYVRWKKIKPIRLLDMLDFGVPSFALGQAIGRWGNYFNQEAYGFEVTNPAHMWFPLAVFIDKTSTIHYATFFYESLWCVLLCIFLLAVRKRFRHCGDVTLTYLMLYGFERMLVEGFRTDSLYLGVSKVTQIPASYAFIVDANGIRISQLLSGLLFFAIAVFFIVRYFKEKTHPFLITNVLNANYISAQETKEVDETENVQNVEVDVEQKDNDILQETIEVDETRKDENIKNDVEQKSNDITKEQAKSVNAADESNDETKNPQ